MSLYRSTALAALLLFGAGGGAMAGHTGKAMPAKKMTAAMPMQYECTHCNIKLSAKQAKAHKMKCDCGMKLTAVKMPTPAAQYECTHCNVKMTAKAAKAHGMKCDCGMKLSVVKPMKAKKA